MGVWTSLDDPVPYDRDCRPIALPMLRKHHGKGPYPCTLGITDCVEHIVDACVFWCKKPWGCNDLYRTSLGYDLSVDLGNTSG